MNIWLCAFSFFLSTRLAAVICLDWSIRQVLHVLVYVSSGNYGWVGNANSLIYKVSCPGLRELSECLFCLVWVKVGLRAMSSGCWCRWGWVSGCLFEGVDSGNGVPSLGLDICLGWFCCERGENWSLCWGGWLNFNGCRFCVSSGSRVLVSSSQNRLKSLWLLLPFSLLRHAIIVHWQYCIDGAHAPK